MDTPCHLNPAISRFSSTQVLPLVEIEFRGCCCTIWPSPVPLMWLPLPVKCHQLHNQVLIFSKMPQWLVAVVLAQGQGQGQGYDAWDLWAARLLSSSGALYLAGSVWSSHRKRLFRVGGHRGNPENIDSLPRFQGMCSNLPGYCNSLCKFQQIVSSLILNPVGRVPALLA